MASTPSVACSEAPDGEDAGVQIVRCADFTIAAETSAARSSARSLAAHPGVIQLDFGAVAISVSAARLRVLTPDAIVDANDAELAVLANDGETLAATWRGRATILRRSDGSVSSVAGPLQDAALGQRLERLRRALQRAIFRP